MKLLRSRPALLCFAFASLTVVLRFCVPISSQVTQGPAVAQDLRLSDWNYGERIPPVANLPFTATVEFENVNQLADGTVISHKTYNQIARDSKGRTYHEVHQWIGATGSQETKIIRITLYDPSTRTRTELSPLTKTARQMSGSAPYAVSEQRPGSKTASSHEDLGTQTIEGLQARGERISQTFPANTLGNDRPFIVSAEYWYSEELQINLRSKRSDPRLGTQTIQVTQLLRHEPDADLFTVPEGFHVTNQTLSEQQAYAGSAGVDGFSANGLAKAGVGSTSIPSCVYCPNPEYTDKARAAKLSGSVVLRLVVTAEGNAENITVVSKLGLGLDEKAVEAVQQWRFKPASDPDGNPVATVVPVEVTFRLR